jgi:hypothetical protein
MFELTVAKILMTHTHTRWNLRLAKIEYHTHTPHKIGIPHPHQDAPLCGIPVFTRKIFEDFCGMVAGGVFFGKCQCREGEKSGEIYHPHPKLKLNFDL